MVEEEGWAVDKSPGQVLGHRQTLVGALSDGLLHVFTQLNDFGVVHHWPFGDFQLGLE